MNFVFLSKLLPLFVYPLGLSCLLLISSLIIWWKRPKWTPFPIMLAFLILYISSNPLISDTIMRSLEWKYNYKEELPTTEAIIILGGGIKSGIDPQLMRDLGIQGDRVIYGGKLYLEKKAPLIIVTGGRIQWLGKGIPEAKEMSNILQKMGVPASAIIEEPLALNTYENAVNVRKILEKLKINKILLVTSAFHIPRALMVFKHQGIDVIPAPTGFSVSKNNHWFENSIQLNLLYFFPDSQRLSQTTVAIKEYLGILVYKLKGWL